MPLVVPATGVLDAAAAGAAEAVAGRSTTVVRGAGFGGNVGFADTGLQNMHTPCQCHPYKRTSTKELVEVITNEIIQRWVISVPGRGLVSRWWLGGIGTGGRRSRGEHFGSIGPVDSTHPVEA